MSQKEKVISSILIVVGSVALLSGKAAHQADESIPTLSVCEALSHPEKYDGRIVRIRDQVVGTSEGTAFFGEACPGVFVTNGKVWPSGIAWTMPTSGTIIHKVNFTFDWESSKEVDKKWRKLRKRYPDRCIAATYTGMFESWSEATAKKADSSGHLWVIPGFGHLDAAPAQLVLKSADDVAPVTNCK
jgi:hypothetical protein